MKYRYRVYVVREGQAVWYGSGNSYWKLVAHMRKYL